jgi:TonB-dependent SusC/RagA subfamily outer membrane receptor
VISLIRMKAAFFAVVLAMCLYGVPERASAQATGTIRGKVTDARSGRPLASAQVSVPGTGRGALTNANGDFLMLNIPAGTHNVRVQLIGYSNRGAPATVAEGQTAVVNFSLEQEALALDEVVVTGTAGQARRREVGNSIAQINLADVAEPVQNVDQLLQSRSPGVVVTESSGMAGSGAQIRLRGSTSVTMSNQPLIYVDGVRVRSDAYRKNVPPGDFSGRSGNVQASPLSDINTADIDRIEVIKGAAATTLYGTEAAAGVIQIFTKRGRSGAPRWTAEIDQGFNRLMAFAPDPRPFLNIDDYVRGRGSFLDNNLPGTGIGYRQEYSLSVNGGGDALQYFVSGNLSDSEGVLPLDSEGKVGVRGNFTFTPLQDLQLSWNSSYNRTSIQNTPAGNNAHGLTLNAFRQERNYFSSGNPDTVRQVLAYDINTWIDRFITGATAVYEPFTNFTNRLTVGYDLASQENRNLRPYGFVAAPRGIISDQRFNSTALTFDYVGSYQLKLGDALSSTLSFGGQSITTEEVNTVAVGNDLPGPGAPTVSNASIPRAVEERERVITAGFFGQALIGYQDKYFLTAGMRVDGNSAFGQDFGLQAYPKVSASYVVSEEPFWPEQMGTVKLRAAYGESGRAPGAFDAVRTWDAVGYGGIPAFWPRNLGNPNLGPERTGEIELGFDGSFLNDRLTSEFTWYYQKTTDALFRVRQPPSNGWANVDLATFQLENVGTLRNAGIELGLNATLIDRPNFGWNLGGSVYTNRSLVVDLGGASEFAIGGGWIKEGFPIMAERGHRLINSHLKTDPVELSSLPNGVCPSDMACIERDAIYGPQQPTHVLGLTTTFRMPRGVAFTARGEYQGGSYIEDGASQNALQRAVRWPTCNNAYGLIEANQRNELTAWERKFCIQSNYENDFLIYPKDFFKLRELTLQVPVTGFVPGTSSAALTLSARNWYTWKHRDFLIFDPEMVGNGGFGEERNASITEHIPPTASFVASLRVSF